VLGSALYLRRSRSQIRTYERMMREHGDIAPEYFSSVGDPFGTGARTASIARTTASKAAKARARKAVRTHAGHVRLAR
jgi:hypothetical protein